MTVPLGILAVCAVVLGFIGTPAWPWFQAFLTGEELAFKPSKLFAWDHLSVLLGSSCLALGGCHRAALYSDSYFHWFTGYFRHFA